MAWISNILCWICALMFFFYFCACCACRDALRCWAGFPLTGSAAGHTPAADWKSAHVNWHWSPLYMLPDDFVSTAWCMAPACTNLIDCFLICFPVNFTQGSNLVFALLPSVFHLVSFQLVTLCPPPVQRWVTSPPALLRRILRPVTISTYTCILPVNLQYISMLPFSLPGSSHLGSTTPTNLLVWYQPKCEWLPPLKITSLSNLAFKLCYDHISAILKSCGGLMPYPPRICLTFWRVIVFIDVSPCMWYEIVSFHRRTSLTSCHCVFLGLLIIAVWQV